MDDHFASLRDATAAALLTGSGATSEDFHRAVDSGTPPRELTALVQKIRSRACTVTDRPIARWSTHEAPVRSPRRSIFLSAALCAGARRVRVPRTRCDTNPALPPALFWTAALVAPEPVPLLNERPCRGRGIRARERAPRPTGAERLHDRADQRHAARDPRAAEEDDAGSSQPRARRRAGGDEDGCFKRAVQDALEVAFLFNIYDRLADAMGWDVPPVPGGYYQVAARRLLKQGYN